MFVGTRLGFIVVRGCVYVERLTSCCRHCGTVGITQRIDASLIDYVLLVSHITTVSHCWRFNACCEDQTCISLREHVAV